MKLLVVGTRFGSNYLEAARASPNWEIGGVVANTRQSLEEAGKKFGIDEKRRFTDLKVALDTLSDIDAVAITTPNNTHHELAKLVLDKGFNIVVEKPLTETWADAVDLVRRLDAHPGKKACVMQTLRGDVMIRLMERFLRDGMIGKIEQLLFESHWNWVVEDPGSHRNWRFQLPDMFLDDIGVHQIDEIRMLAGNKKAMEVQGSTWTPASYPIKSITAASASSTWVMEDNVNVSYFGSMASKGHDVGWYGRVHVFGEKGCAYRDASGQPYVYLDGKSEPIGLDDKYGDDLDEYLPLIEFEKVAYVLEDFYHAIKDNRQPVTDIHDNLNTLAILLAIKKAAGKKRVVDVQREFPLP